MHPNLITKAQFWAQLHPGGKRMDGKLKAAFETFARTMAERYRPGTVYGRRADDMPVGEEQHFYVCKDCGQAVDMRDLGEVFHHEVPDHQRLPEN